MSYAVCVCTELYVTGWGGEVGRVKGEIALDGGIG